jgi:Na+/H+ antiporter NhaC
MTDYGFLSVVPPLLTVVLALWTRDGLLALIAGIVTLTLAAQGPALTCRIECSLGCLDDILQETNSFS